MEQDSLTLHGDGISATIVQQGAELVSLRNAEGIEFLWQAGPAWRRHSPVLFPIVGRLRGDQLRQLDEKRFPWITWVRTVSYTHLTLPTKRIV